MSSDAAEFLDVAGRLANQIADSAVWFEERCSWTGARPDAPRGAGYLATQSALGPDLYEGTSGIALFLAEAGVRLDDARLRATALGAVSHALAHAVHLDSEARHGLYSGPIGIAYAAARIACALDAEHVLSGARELLRQSRTGRTISAASDAMSGLAGTVTGLVAISELIDEPWMLDRAVELGEDLAGRAEATAGGWSWAAPNRHRFHNLCGYSHGAAGIGHAFLELFAVTGDARFREAGEAAFDYERSWRDPVTGAWPDLREVTRTALRDAPMPTDASWCNGAAGIALSRLRAAELLGSAVVRRDAELALAACAAQVSDSQLDDFSLCHGAAGAADALLHAEGSRHMRDLAAEVGRRGIERHLGPGAAGFPCGVPQGETPALLLGFAGIGMYYLRLADPAVPSPLLVRS